MAIYSTIAVLFLISVVNGYVQNCLIYNFDSGLEGFDNAGTMCETVSSWTVGRYSDINVDHPNTSDVYIYSPPIYSCSASFPFNMTAGSVEADVYFMPNNSFDGLVTFVMKKTENGADTVVSTATLSNFEGWNTLSMPISAVHGNFVGYVVFYGTTTDESALLLLDSFRFIPSSLTLEDCLARETEGSGDETEEGTTTEAPVEEENEESSGENIDEGSGEEGSGEIEEGSGEIEEESSGEFIEVGSGEEDGSGDIEEEVEIEEQVDRCVTYNFEENFDLEFTHDNYFCQGFLTWQLGNYTDIAGPNSDSHSFIYPSEGSSCVASNVFYMSPNGIIEANVYMQAVTTLDHIIILVQRLRDDNADAVVGFSMYYPENTAFVDGWNVLTFNVTDFDSFYGYLILFGSETEGSRVLVDSVRYIPPNTPSTDEACAFY